MDYTDIEQQIGLAARASDIDKLIDYSSLMANQINQHNRKTLSLSVEEYGYAYNLYHWCEQLVDEFYGGLTVYALTV